MRRLLLAAAMVLAGTPAFAANLATPTATAAAATPAATPIALEPQANIIAKGSCVFDAPSITAMPTSSGTGVPVITVLTCGVPGVEVGDLPLARMTEYSSTGAGAAYNALLLRDCAVKTKNQLDCYVQHVGQAAIDPAPLMIHYVVFR